MVQACEGLACR